MGSFHYFLYVQVHKNSSGLFLFQQQYALDLLKKENMESCSPADSSFSTCHLSTHHSSIFSDSSLYRSIVEEASLKALKEWCQAKSKITIFLFNTTSSVEIPAIDYKIANLLCLDPPVIRLMLYHQGCHAGGNVLCTAKDLA